MSFPAISDYEIPDDDFNKIERSRVVQESIDARRARRRADARNAHHAGAGAATYGAALAHYWKGER